MPSLLQFLLRNPPGEYLVGPTPTLIQDHHRHKYDGHPVMIVGVSGVDEELWMVAP